jgi:hypothetical protein
MILAHVPLRQRWNAILRKAGYTDRRQLLDGGEADQEAAWPAAEVGSATR